jgi:hypothetical protein
MARCQFVYIRAKGERVSGGQCDQEVHYINNTLCVLHNNKKHWLSENGDMATESIGNSFPRLASKEEIRKWVTEARQYTSPDHNRRRACVCCGILWRDNEMVSVTEDELLQHRTTCSPSVQKYYGSVAGFNSTKSVANERF